MLKLRQLKCYFHTAARLNKSSKLLAIGQKWKQKTLKGVPVLSHHDNNKNIYVLSMFPYPSGVLHIGHLRVYAISDSLNRFYQQNGYKVIHPMGWDAFGLPAENAAIERKIDPAIWTSQNIEKMKKQMNNMLVNFDWEREVTTCNPDYYKFTQFIFLKLFENGLAYQKEAEINWDPVDKTVLANEQVDSQGKSWRSGALVEKKLLKQWFLGITKFAHELRSDLNSLKRWPSKVKAMQKNWIGESAGADIIFQTDDPLIPSIKVFTTRAETLFSVEYLALSINHAIVKKYASFDSVLNADVNYAKSLPEDSKKGFIVSKLSAYNPLTKKKIPVYFAPYVLDNYGHGAVMGCPAHDERDYLFWRENNSNAHIEPCVTSIPSDAAAEEAISLPFTSKEAVMLKSTGEYEGLCAAEARSRIVQKLQTEGSGESIVRYKLRDWLISRQRYWGTPIPIIHCGNCGPVPVPEEQLPVVLPKVHELKSSGKPLSEIPDFVNTNCPKCGKHAKRETDTMDTFIDSSWYYFRYLDPHNNQLPFSPESVTKYMPVDLYIGGVEHAILHLLYSRFISKFLASIGMWDGKELKNEPFKRLITQGMVHGKTYIDPENGRFLKPDELDISKKKVVIKGTNLIPKISSEKMSKSKYNGADPNECISKHGPDATRAHILFQAPIEDILNWEESKIVGIERWLMKLLSLVKGISEQREFPPNYETPADLNQEEAAFHNEMQRLLKSITNSFEESLSLNTVISDYMKITNVLDTGLRKTQIRDELVMQNVKKLVTVIYPVVPSISEELASIIIDNQKWDWNYYEWVSIEPCKESNEINFQIVVNGRMRFMHVAEKDFFECSPEEVVSKLMKLPDGRKYLLNRRIKKLIMKHNIISFILEK